MSETNDVKDRKKKKRGGEEGRGWVVWEERYQKDPLKAREEKILVEFDSG